MLAVFSRHIPTDYAQVARGEAAGGPGGTGAHVETASDRRGEEGGRVPQIVSAEWTRKSANQKVDSSGRLCNNTQGVHVGQRSSINIGMKSVVFLHWQQSSIQGLSFPLSNAVWKSLT